ncbi:hypothetical protein LCGC14_0397520 [marine sediment metagenome]|uniref:Uncharacterized protein n=1 Tax=marine sediment metagenome TaxID=412755 RepID=A0A0F9W716_9ZZZZ
MRAIVVRKYDQRPMVVDSDQVVLVAGQSPCLGMRFESAQVIDFHAFTGNQMLWFNGSFLCRMEPDAVVKT